MAQKEDGGWLSEDAVDCLRMICSIPSNTEELCLAYFDELSAKTALVPVRQASEDQYVTDATGRDQTDHCNRAKFVHVVNPPREQLRFLSIQLKPISRHPVTN